MATILIADDRAVNRQYLATLLAYCGHHIIEANDGQEALEIARRACPDLIITDLLMPVLDGCGLARQLRAEPQTEKIPVIFYTATYRARDARELAEKCGVHHILTKPCDPQVILDMVKAVLGLDHHPVTPALDAEPADPPEQESHVSQSDLQTTGMRLASLVEVGLDLGGERDPVVLVERFGRAAQDIIGTAFAAVGILGSDGLTLRHFITCQKDQNAATATESAWAADFCAQMPALLAGRESCRVAALEADPHGVRARAGSATLMAAEIRSGGRLSGWLLLAGKLPDAAFTALDEQIAVSLAGQLAVFYEGAQLFADLQAKALDLEAEIARRAAVEAELRKLTRAVEHSPASIVITDAQGRIEYVNPKFEAITGYTAAEVCGQNPRLLKSGETSPEVYRQMWERLTAGGEWRGEFHNRRKNGDLFWELASISAIRDGRGAITHFVAVKEDITEKKRLEAQFRRAQRLESIGALAAGVAHDLNNLLTPILMSASMLRQPLTAEDFASVVNNIETCARRGADVVDQVLTCGRGTMGVRRPLAVRPLLRDIQQAVTATFPKEIRIETQVSDDTWRILGEGAQVHQMLMNLALNARDAMPEGGLLRFRAANMEVDTTYATMLREGRPGSFVVFEVSDSGVGIPLDLRERVFEAGFTTKADGQGSGLGLPGVHRMVQEHEGFMTLQSEPGRGTTFRVFLPAALDALPVATPVDPAPAPPARSGEVVLVVDDEASIRTVARVVLEAHGYEVLLACEGAEAMAVYAQNSARIAAVLTDLAMPVMDGVSLIGALRRIRPGVKVIASSGFSEKARVAALKSLEVSAYLVKPYSADILLSTLDTVLRGGTVMAGPSAPMLGS